MTFAVPSFVGRDVVCLAHSARALVAAVARAGGRPHVIDAFGDVDATGFGGRVHAAADEATWLPTLAGWPSHWPLLYGGAIENRPALLAAASRQRPIWGILGMRLHRLRDPVALGRCLPDSVAMPERTPSRPAAAAAGEWLWKPHASGGGHAVTFASPDDPATGSWHRFIAGRSRGLLFTAPPASEALRSLAVVQHHPRRGDRPFFVQDLTLAIGERPPTVATCLANALTECLRRLPDEGGLVGPLGVDVVEAPDGRTWVLECNPRFTAGHALWEWATGGSVFENRTPDARERADQTKRTGRQPWAGQRVALAERSFAWPMNDAGLREAVEVAGCDLADRPHPGTLIATGEPICTLLTRAASEAAVLAQLDDGEAVVSSSASEGVTFGDTTG